MTDPKTFRPAAGSSPAAADINAGPNQLVTQTDPGFVLSAERLVAATEWFESGHVRLHRRVVSETRTIDVVVRREELVIETRDAAPGVIGESYVGTANDGPVMGNKPSHAPTPPLVLLLREEVPELLMQTRVYERVTAEVVAVREMAVWHDSVRHEEAVAETKPI